MAKATLPHRRHQAAGPIRRVVSELERELHVRITPMGGVTYAGSSAQLIAERLVPPGVDWQGDRFEWEFSGYSYVLRRVRPHGLSASTWRAGPRDHWELRCELEGTGWDDPVHAPRIHAAWRELDRACWLASPEYIKHWKQLIAARGDDAFQQMLGRVAGS